MFYRKSKPANIERHRFVITMLMVLLVSVSHGSYAEKIYVCSAYNSGPFIINEQSRTGLIYTFTDFLNEHAQGKYSFEVLTVPRARLLLTLTETNHCIVPLVSYQWFDPEKQLYSWSQPIINDANVILSSQSQQLESIAKQQVAEMTTSQVIGFFDQQIETLIADKTVHSFSSTSLDKSIKMVARKRIDFIVSGRIPLQYLIHELKLQDQVYISQHTTASFERSVLMPKSNPALTAFIDEQITHLKTSTLWQKTLASYGIKDN